MITYNDETYTARLVNFTVDRATPSGPTGAPDRTDQQSDSDSYNLLLIVILICVIVPLAIVVIILIVVLAIKLHQVRSDCFKRISSYIVYLAYLSSNTAQNLTVEYISSFSCCA